METTLLIVIGLALLVMVISTLAIAVAAFRQSVIWGLVYLFVPFGNFVFIIRHWAVAKAGFLFSLASGLVALGAVTMLPGTYKNLSSIPAFAFSTGSSTDRSTELTTQIQEKRDRIFQLETAFNDGSPILVKQFGELEKKRTVLNVSDTEAVTRFNEEAATYHQQNAQRKVMLQELEMARQELSKLLTERATIGASAPQGSGQRIVMYTTARCPACKAAKQYMNQRGISYTEKDVEASAADATEFRNLGGRAVPLILVGDKRMEGFYPKKFEEML